MAVDLTEDIGKGIGNLEPVVKLSREMVKKRMEIEKLETLLDKANKDLVQMETVTMPGLMRTTGITGLPLTGGYLLELQSVFRASLPAKTTIEKAPDDERPFLIQRFADGLKWIRAHKGDAIISNVVKLELGKGKEANERFKKISDLAIGLHIVPERAETVHHATLSNYLKELVSQGVDVPYDTFGVFSGDVAKVKKLKEKNK